MTIERRIFRTASLIFCCLQRQLLTTFNMKVYVIIFNHLKEHPFSTNEIFMKHTLICPSFVLTSAVQFMCRTERQAADNRYLVAELVISTAILKVLYIRPVVSPTTGQLLLHKRNIHSCNLELPVSFSSTPSFS